MLAVNVPPRLKVMSMTRFLAALFALFALALPIAAQADPADIDAAARGVVRVVILGSNGQEVYPVSHGSGFAVTPTRILTNAHVVREVLQDDTLRIGIVPSEGDDAVYGKPLSISPRNDLALVEITGDLRLPPLTLSGNGNRDSGEVSAVGYPMNVDRAQGLDIGDIFKSQPPVKSRGFLSGRRPSRNFDTILHTAPIARGNSGGPLLDGCGRVLGINSFGADSDGSDAEFYFAVSMREVIPFLRQNGVNGRVNELPCRSLAELDKAERDRVERERQQAREEVIARTEEQREKRARARAEAEESVRTDRENMMALAFVLTLIAFGAAAFAWQARRGDDGEKKAMIAGTVAAIALTAAIALWFTRPGLDEVDRRVAAAMQDGDATPDPSEASVDEGGTLICTLDLARSRVTGAPDRELEFSWAEDGCVNGRTQYGFAAGTWSRVFVPNEEDAVSVNRYDPDSRTFRTDRYLLGRSAMGEARTARGKYTPPKCGTDGASSRLGDLQGSVTALLPERPNERLVYGCEAKGN